MVKPLGNNCENMRVKKRVIDSLPLPAVLDQTVLFGQGRNNTITPRCHLDSGPSTGPSAGYQHIPDG